MSPQTQSSRQSLFDRRIARHRQNVRQARSNPRFRRSLPTPQLSNFLCPRGHPGRQHRRLHTDGRFPRQAFQRYRLARRIHHRPAASRQIPAERPHHRRVRFFERDAKGGSCRADSGGETRLLADQFKGRTEKGGKDLRRVERIGHTGRIRFEQKKKSFCIVVEK